jgi:hypothetical protein
MPTRHGFPCFDQSHPDGGNLLKSSSRPICDQQIGQDTDVNPINLAKAETHLSELVARAEAEQI